MLLRWQSVGITENESPYIRDHLSANHKTGHLFSADHVTGWSNQRLRYIAFWQVARESTLLLFNKGQIKERTKPQLSYLNVRTFHPSGAVLKYGKFSLHTQKKMQTRQGIKQARTERKTPPPVYQVAKTVLQWHNIKLTDESLQTLSLSLS